MKKCMYCGHNNDDSAWRCDKCKAGFPHEEPKNEKPVKDTNKKRRGE